MFTKPPSAIMFWPDMYVFKLLATKSTTLEISSTPAIRRIGIISDISCILSGPKTLRVRSVNVKPGDTALMSTLCSANSAAAAKVRPLIPNLLLE